jgi:hypothetical protein
LSFASQRANPDAIITVCLENAETSNCANRADKQHEQPRKTIVPDKQHEQPRKSSPTNNTSNTQKNVARVGQTNVDRITKTA